MKLCSHKNKQADRQTNHVVRATQLEGGRGLRHIANVALKSKSAAYELPPRVTMCDQLPYQSSKKSALAESD